MAVIKSLDLWGGHLWNGEYMETTSDVNTLVSVIKDIRGRADLTQLFYIGESLTLDVDLDKIKCPICKSKLERFV